MFTFDSLNKKLGYHQIKILINTGMVDIFYSIIYHNYAQSSTKQVRYKQFHLNLILGPNIYISVKKEKKGSCSFLDQVNNQTPCKQYTIYSSRFHRWKKIRAKRLICCFHFQPKEP